MQDKSLDAMAKKYKEEMMRLYAHGGSGGGLSASNQSASNQSASEKNGTGNASAVTQAAEPEAVKPEINAVNGTSQQQEPQKCRPEAERLEHPPMPQIPKVSQKNNEKLAENKQGSKFPSPDEIMAAETNAAETSVKRDEPAPIFDSGHEQGNYDFTEAEQQRVLSFEDGEGCLKLEVSGVGQPLDCALVLVFRVTDCGDVLTATFFTDEKGETEVITLPVLDLDEKYTVTVAKEGFFTVRDLEIPIFDSIKSIQPVELKCEKNS